MQILITGGTGFIGTALSRALLADGHRLHVWSRAPAKTAAMVPGAKVVKGNFDEGNLGKGSLPSLPLSIPGT